MKFKDKDKETGLVVSFLKFNDKLLYYKAPGKETVLELAYSFKKLPVKKPVSFHKV